MIKTVQEIIIVSAENYGSFLDMYPVHILRKLSISYKIILLTEEEGRESLISKVNNSMLAECNLQILCPGISKDLNKLLKMLLVIEKCVLIVGCTHGHNQRFIINLMEYLQCKVLKIGYPVTRPSLMEFQHYNQRSRLNPKGKTFKVPYDFKQWYNILLQTNDEFQNDFELSRLDKIYCPSIEWAEHYAQYFNSRIDYDIDIESYPKSVETSCNADKTMLVALDAIGKFKSFVHLVNDIIWAIEKNNLRFLTIRPHPSSIKAGIYLRKELSKILSSGKYGEITISLSVPGETTLESDINQCRFLLTGLTTILYTHYKYCKKIFYVSKGYAEGNNKTRNIYRTMPVIEEMVPTYMTGNECSEFYIIHKGNINTTQKSKPLSKNIVESSHYECIKEFLRGSSHKKQDNEINILQ